MGSHHVEVVSMVSGHSCQGHLHFDLSGQFLYEFIFMQFRVMTTHSSDKESTSLAAFHISELPIGIF